ncbi:hypothetical protein EV368DRAFT_38504, partial [Lentinula lateritia]
YYSRCRMKHNGSVVKEELLVHGFGDLRVTDSSAFPWVLGTHSHALTVAVAENLKCTNMIFARCVTI